MVTTDPYTKMGSLTTSKMTALHIVSLFMDKWVISYWCHEYFLTNSGTKFILNLFDFLMHLYGTKYLTTTVYYLKTVVQAERFNKTIIAWPGKYLVEHRRGRDIHIRHLTHAKNIQMRRSTPLTPFSLLSSRQPLVLQLSTKRRHYWLTLQRLQTHIYWMIGFYPALQQCDKAQISKWNRLSNDIRTIMIKRLANR